MANTKEVKQVKYGKRPAKVPVIMQLEVTECGATCLSMILAYYGKWITLEEAREACGVSRDGQNALNILKAARGYNMEADGYSMGIDAFEEFTEFPCIVFWNHCHFIVVTGMKGDKIYVNDPAIGNRIITREEFSKNFTGIVIALKPTENFLKAGHQKTILEYAKSHLVGTMVAVIFVILTTIINNIMGIINPIFSKVFMDRIITGTNPGWLNPFIILLTLVSVVTLLNSLINVLCSLRISGKMDAVGSSAFIWKALNLPMKFYSQRMVGDVQARQNSAATISNTLVNTFAPLFLNTIMMIFYLVVMLKQSVLLSVIGIGTVVFNYIMSNYISKKRVNLSRAFARDSGKLYSTTTAGIEMIETIKASGVERGYFERWAGLQALVNNNDIKTMELNRNFGLIPTILFTLSNNLVTILGIYLVIKGEFTCGSVMAFQGLVTSFMSPAMSLINTNQRLIEMRTDMERLEDVMNYPIQSPFSEEKNYSDENINFEKLHGEIELKGVRFGYSPLANPLIDDFNIKIKPGSKIAFVGKSGCGKSTLAKLISGLYSPWEGEILFDSRPMSEIEPHVFRSSLAVVNQDITLFHDTIGENIRMWDKSIKDFEVILAARDAQIYDDIIKRPDGFDHVLTENGSDLSGGQRQRIEIARTLALDPTIVILDEATSALDAITEKRVVNSIAERGITCIVVAHRLSTIRDCDEIIVMDKGKIADRGTHEELIKREGLYKELVTNE